MSRSTQQEEPGASFQSMPAGGSLEAVRSMLEAKSVALVGASPRAGSFGERMVLEAQKSAARPKLHLVNPHYDSVLGHPCVASLDEIADPVDLVLFGIPDSALEAEMQRSARRGDRSAVIFANAYEEPAAGRRSLRERLGDLATGAGMALCGGGCMGFVNVSHGLRAVGYIEPEEIPHGPVALVTHSGSIFSAMLRTRRHLGFTLAVSSGQELVTTAASYVDYALELEKTRVVALVLETMREPEALRRVLERAANRDVRVVALTVGASTRGRSMVEAHTGALAGAEAAWEALFDAYDVAWVKDLEELADTVELFSADRGSPINRRGGFASVHDSGAERALLADWADEIGLRFAEISPTARERLRTVLEPGLEPANPLDVWGTGADTARVFGECLTVLADDPDVAIVALAVDLVREHDFDDSYPRAALAAHQATTTPLCVLANMASALDADAAAELRAAGVPVLEGTRSGLLAVRHLLDGRIGEVVDPSVSRANVDRGRQQRWTERLATAGGRGAAAVTASEALELVADYGIETVASIAVADAAAAVEAARRVGYPVVMKTDHPEILHKSDVGAVRTGLRTTEEVMTSYEEFAERFGPRVTVSATAPPGVELALGLVDDPHLGPLVVVGAGGVLVELLSDRAVGLPPIDQAGARRLLERLRVRPILDGVRGAGAADLGALEAAIVNLSHLAVELNGALEALDVNPVLCGPKGAVAVDALVIPQRKSPVD